MDNFDAHKWFKKEYLGEGHTEDKTEKDQFIRRYDQLSDDDKLKLAKIQAMMDREKKDQSKSSSLIGRMGDRSLREDDLNEDRRRVVDYDNRDDRTTELFLDNGDSVEVDVIELYNEIRKNNEDLAEGKLLKEVMDVEMEDYVSAMYDSDVDQEAEEGFQSDVWSKAEYASNAYDESSIFLELIDHLKSVGGKDVVEGNPDIKLELLPNEDIRWSANVTHY